MSALPLQTIGATVKMATETFVTNKVSAVSNYVDKVVDDRAPVKRIAMFIIPVNREPPIGYPEFSVGTYYYRGDTVMYNGSPYRCVTTHTASSWVLNNWRSMSSSFAGFELKASTNNFSHVVSKEISLQFYAQSEVADKGAPYNEWDKMKMYVGTVYGSSWDARAYTKIGNTLDWGYELRNVVVLVDASCIVKHPGDWLREDNEDLMWCYLRNTNDGIETEDGTDQTIWHPIAPVRWFSKLPNWAEQ
jgi:hypothetical protein